MTQLYVWLHLHEILSTLTVVVIVKVPCVLLVLFAPSVLKWITVRRAHRPLGCHLCCESLGATLKQAYLSPWPLPR